MKDLANTYSIVGVLFGVFPLILIAIFFGLLFSWFGLFLLPFPIIAIISGGFGIKGDESPTKAIGAIILGIILIIVLVSLSFYSLTSSSGSW